MTADEHTTERPTGRDRSSWLWSVASITAVFGVMDLRRDAPVFVAELPGLIFTAVFFGAAALFVGRDRRERLGAAFAPLPALAVGVPAIRLLTPGWALAALVATLAATAAAFGSWHKRRTPPEPEAWHTAEPPAAPDAGDAERPRTPAERRAATEARMVEGAERDRLWRAEQAAEHERAAELRRAEAAARREVEAAAGR